MWLSCDVLTDGSLSKTSSSLSIVLHVWAVSETCSEWVFCMLLCRHSFKGAKSHVLDHWNSCSLFTGLGCFEKYIKSYVWPFPFWSMQSLHGSKNTYFKSDRCCHCKVYEVSKLERILFSTNLNKFSYRIMFISFFFFLRWGCSANWRSVAV